MKETCVYHTRLSCFISANDPSRFHSLLSPVVLINPCSQPSTSPRANPPQEWNFRGYGHWTRSTYRGSHIICWENGSNCLHCHLVLLWCDGKLTALLNLLYISEGCSEGNSVVRESLSMRQWNPILGQFSIPHVAIGYEIRCSLLWWIICEVCSPFSKNSFSNKCLWTMVLRG